MTQFNRLEPASFHPSPFYTHLFAYMYDQLLVRCSSVHKKPNQESTNDQDNMTELILKLNNFCILDLFS